MAKKRLKLFVFILFFMLAFVSVSDSAYAFLDPEPDASLSGAPSQIGPAESFTATVSLENTGTGNGYCSGFALFTDNVAITSTSLGNFDSKSSINSKWAEWYKSLLYWNWPWDKVTGSATITAPNYKDANSFNLQYRGWMRKSSCSGTVIRDPTSGSSCEGYPCHQKTINVVPQNPQVSISGAPNKVDAGEIFTVTITLTEYGWKGYNGGGVHLRVENGYIQDNFNKGNFHSFYTGPNFIEFQLGGAVTLPVGSVKTATVPIKAGNSGEVKLYYRAWTRDIAHYIYRDPNDAIADGQSNNGEEKTPVQWNAKPKTVTIESAVDPHADSKCYNDDVYWYDSLGNKGQKKDECGEKVTIYSNPYCSPYNPQLIVKSKTEKQGLCALSTNSCYNTSDVVTVETVQLCSTGFLCGDGKCVADTLPNLKILPEDVEVR